MARLWRTLAGRAIWWLTKCEETAFIADYLEVASFIEARYSWKAEFEDNYFHRSEGLSQKTVDNINTVRKRRSLTSIVITETDADEYARDTALDKPAHRRKLREELTAMSAAHRAKLVDECRAQIQLRPPPHRSFDELQEEHRRSGHLSARTALALPCEIRAARSRSSTRRPADGEPGSSGIRAPSIPWPSARTGTPWHPRARIGR